MLNSEYKLRSKRLKELGYKNYLSYLDGTHWQKRRAEYQAAHMPICGYCDQPAHALHHRTYQRLGAEADGDLEWVCQVHHEEAQRFGRVRIASDRQREILREHGYGEQFIGTVTMHVAFELIGQLSRGEVKSPIQMGL